MSPIVIALYRFVWSGLLFIPVVTRGGVGNLGDVGWGRGIVLALLGGLPQATLSYAGFLFVPLGHGAIIQPSCASLGGLLLAALVLREPLPARRIGGALVMVVGLIVIGTEALKTLGTHGLAGDSMFVAAGFSFAIFGILLRQWRTPPVAATAVISVLSLAGLPLFIYRLGDVLAVGFYENLLQAIVQGALAGAGAIYLFTRAVILLGASRAVVFPSLVPPFTLLLGFIALGEAPTLLQLVGLVIVVIGFRLTQKA